MSAEQSIDFPLPAEGEVSRLRQVLSPILKPDTALLGDYETAVKFSRTEIDGNRCWRNPAESTNVLTPKGHGVFHGLGFKVSEEFSKGLNEALLVVSNRRQDIWTSVRPKAEDPLVWVGNPGNNTLNDVLKSSPSEIVEFFGELQKAELLGSFKEKNALPLIDQIAMSAIYIQEMRSIMKGIATANGYAEDNANTTEYVALMNGGTNKVVELLKKIGLSDGVEYIQGLHSGVDYLNKINGSPKIMQELQSVIQASAPL